MTEHSRNLVQMSTICLMVLTFLLFGASYFTSFPSYDSSRFLLVFLLSILAVALNYWVINKGIFSIGALLLLSAFFVCSKFWRVDYGYVEPAMYAIYFYCIWCGGILISRLNYKLAVIDGFLVALVVAFFLYGLVNLISYFLSVIDPMVSASTIVPTNFENIRLFSHLATWVAPLFPLVIISKLGQSSGLLRCVAMSALVLVIWLALVTSSRGTFLAFFCSFIFVRIFFPQTFSAGWMKYFALGIFGGSIMWLLVSWLFISYFEAEVTRDLVRFGTSGRLDLWLEAVVRSFHEFPLGMGALSWIAQDNLLGELDTRFGSPHNMYLFWAAEYGWFSVLMFCLIFVFAFRKVLNSYNESNENRDYKAVFSASVFSALIHSGFSSLFIAPASMVIGLAVLIIFFGLFMECYAPVLRKADRLKVYFGVLVSLIVIGWWGFSVKEYYTSMVDDFAYYDEHVSSQKMPRFWLHGYYPREPALMP